MTNTLFISDYVIMNADAKEDNTDNDRYLIKIEGEAETFIIPDELELKSNCILLNDH